MRDTVWLWAMLAVVACKDGRARVETAETAGPAFLGGRYEVVSIGGRPVATRDEAKAKCDGTPFTSSYVLRESQWKSIDSVFSCGGENPGDQPIVQSDSGNFTMVGDTIQLRVSDIRIGVKGLVALGLFRGDSLLMWFSDEDGGDFLYLKVREP